MIDLHSHILFCLDDGAKDAKETMEMLRIAVKDGISKMVATPHYIYGSNNYDATKLNESLHNVQALIKEEGLNIQLYPGNELYLDYNLSVNLSEGNCLSLAGTDYVLVELPMNTIPNYTENVIYSLLENGYDVILAHPERYIPIQNEPEMLYKFLEMGCLVQINALSVTGAMGKKVQDIAKRFIEKNWVHFVATDCHSKGVRAPKLSPAFELVAGWADKKTAEELFIINPGKVLNNEDIQPAEAAQPPVRTRSFAFLPFLGNKKIINF